MTNPNTSQKQKETNQKQGFGHFEADTSRSYFYNAYHILEKGTMKNITDEQIKNIKNGNNGKKKILS